MNKRYNSIVICGPTATGKTRLAVELADMYDGEIISADSRQIYRHMDLGTGKDLEEYTFNSKKINHHLIDIANPDEIYNLYRYLKDFYKSFNQIINSSKLPVICGGTGLYMEAALKKYQVANVPEDIEFRKTMMKKDIDELKNLLMQNHKLFESTDLSSKKRIVRALEINEFSKNNPVDYSSENAPDLDPKVFCIRIEKEKLNSLIDERLFKRINDGLIEEVERILKMGITKERMYMFGLEYKWVSMFLYGELKKEEMIEKLAVEIHRFAKRQNTWFRGMEKRGIKMNWIEHKKTSQMIKMIISKL